MRQHLTETVHSLPRKNIPTNKRIGTQRNKPQWRVSQTPDICRRHSTVL